MSDRAEYYRRYPRFIGHGNQEMREPDMVINHYVPSERGYWEYRREPNYTTWRMILPINPALMACPVYYVLFDWDGRFLQANGMGYVFYDMYCFFEHLERGEHESEICRRPVRSVDLRDTERTA